MRIELKGLVALVLVAALAAACGDDSADGRNTGNNGGSDAGADVGSDDSGGMGDGAMGEDTSGPLCGDGIVEAPELCDGDCATTCDDGDACTTETMTGTDATCDVLCMSEPVTACVDDDGCCPGGCDATNDNDCGGPTCGDGMVEAPEICDGDCPTSCDDADACTTDSMSGSAAMCDAVCANDPITACMDGDGCCPATCTPQLDSDCVVVCGNGVREAGEQCDDGGTTAGDGCDASCLLEADAFRLSDIDLMDPHIFIDAPIFGCSDINEMVPLNLAEGINTLLQDQIQCDGDCADPADDDGLLDLSFVLRFDPLDQSDQATGPIEVITADCTAPLASTTCAAQANPISETSTYTSDTANTCLMPIAGTTSNYMPAIASPGPSCFASAAVATLPLDIGGILVPLQDVQVAATYQGDPATQFYDGLLMGFISEANADAITLPASLPLVGGEPLSIVLPGGTGNCHNVDDRDVGPDGTTMGWYFYLNFTADPVVYTP